MIYYYYTNTNHENIPSQIKLNDHVITDKEAVLEEWMKSYDNLYNKA